ncbi:MAG: putative transport protein HsrA [Paracidovorax wautersii]|uniref:Putative transport protein HsrA n=1 Tax=Paracidovorax wautersii TaxID=1177982 RepID=A0A7V8FR10_9BURK|nr:MAG: putative transport protein HsrA [Paracidovorax wautersii]
MENLDATIITTALPAMAQSFGVEPARLSIGLSAYLLAIAVGIPASGWLADRFGPRRMFTLAIVVFTLSSIWCGLSGSLASSTAARVLQGLGGALMVPVGRLVVLRTTAKKDLVRAIATITWPGLAAPVLGPALGGWIATHWGWHWIFFLNVPLGLLALWAARRLIHEGPTAQVRRFDGWGFGLTAVGCSLLMLGVEWASHRPVNGLLALAWRHFQRSPAPLLSLEPLRVPTFAVTVVGGSLFRIALGSAPFLLPLMFQLALGFSAVDAGLMLLALFAGNLLIKPATTPMLRRWGFRRLLLGNGLLVAAGFAACAAFTRETPVALIAAVLFVCGVNRSIQFTALNTLAFADIAQPRMSDASTLTSMLQQFNTGLGIAVGALALSVAAWLLGADDAGAASLPPAAFRWALAASSGLALLALLDARRLPADAGAHVSGHRPAPLAR